MVWPLDRQVLNEEWLQRGNSWMKNVVYCRLCICAGRAIYSDLTNVYSGLFALIWSDLMERQTAWEKAWKPITPIESCALSENTNVYKAYDHSLHLPCHESQVMFSSHRSQKLAWTKIFLAKFLSIHFLLFKVYPIIFFLLPLWIFKAVHELVAVKLSI